MDVPSQILDQKLKSCGANSQRLWASEESLALVLARLTLQYLLSVRPHQLAIFTSGIQIVSYSEYRMYL